MVMGIVLRILITLGYAKLLQCIPFWLYKLLYIYNAPSLHSKKQAIDHLKIATNDDTFMLIVLAQSLLVAFTLHWTMYNYKHDKDAYMTTLILTILYTIASIVFWFYLIKPASF